MVNFHGVHNLELFVGVLLKNHNFANTYRKNMIELSFCWQKDPLLLCSDDICITSNNHEDITV